jgi:hypothetical protein
MLVDKILLSKTIESLWPEEVTCLVDTKAGYMELTNNYNIMIIFSFNDINSLFTESGNNDYVETANLIKFGLDRKTQRKRKISNLEMFYDKWLAEEGQ